MGRRRRKGEFFEFLTEVIKSPHGYIWGIIACLLFLALSEWFIPLLFHNEFDKIFHPLFQIPLRAMAVLSIIAALINWAKNFWLNSLQAPTAKEKGYQFEQFVVNKFDRRYFTLKEWRSDKGIDGRYAESNKNPDLEFEFHLRTVRKTFAVECKWRQNYYRGGVEWAKKGQVARYNAFATKRQIPVFVIIGVGGTPDDPNDIFVVPLKVLKYPHAKAEYLAKWKKSGNKNFFFNTQTELLK